MMTMMIFLSEVHADSNGIGFTIPDLPGFAAHHEGNDLGEAVVTAEAVLRDYLAAMVDNGQAVPESTPFLVALRTLEEENGSVPPVIGLRGRMPAGRTIKVNVSMDESAVRMIDNKAAARNLTRSAFLAAAAEAFD